MLFSSNIFLFIFLPLVLLINFILPSKLRNGFLLFASLFFYAWGEPKFLIIMLISILINYLSGIIVNYTRNHENIILKRMTLVICVLVNFGMLFYFKYFNFFLDNSNIVFGSHFELKNIVLPLGISFFTFQGASYTLDVYLGHTRVERNIGKLGLCISFFPQLIAGPIVRYNDIYEQVDSRTVGLDDFTQGIRRFIIGLGKKMLIANQMGLVADQIFGLNIYNITTGISWIGILCYSLQIYFDFLGYSDMAIGLGKMFGFTFKENFNYPYISKNITEFWRRWHISLSTWFRDYIYIPLGGSRRGNVYFNLIVVFLVTGFWHGAAWNFIVWGLWYGMFLIIERVLKSKNYNIPNTLSYIYTIFIILIGWVLFRSPDLNYAFNYILTMFGNNSNKTEVYSLPYFLNIKTIIFGIIGIFASMPIIPFIKQKYCGFKYFNVFKDTYLIIIFFLSIVAIMTSTYNPFIYFRF